jgi:diguanylate cyclase
VKETALVEGQVRLTVSAGVTCTSGEESAEELFERADQALYRAKREGRDRVVVG